MSFESLEPDESSGERRSFTGFALLVLAFVAVASALRWSWYPIFVDTYYHMAAIQGLEQAGGLPTWAFWEMAPGGRVHIYPPAIHVLGYLATFVGFTAESFITFLSWLLYPAFLVATWVWLRRIAGERSALTAVILLCGPPAIFWNQTTFTANALSMTLAPLALLALERERFLACGVLNLVAATAHPMGLFLPPALAINAILRRKKLLAGLLAACAPMVLYLPWLAHIWANRAYLPEERTGGDVSLLGIGAGFGVNLGVALAASALVGIGWILARRREALGLLGPALGFAVVLPMGFGGRFLQFNVHWPLACIGAFGVGMLLDRLDRGEPWRRAATSLLSVGLAFLVLSTWAGVEIRMPRDRGGLPGPRPPLGEGDTSFSFVMGPSAVASLLEPGSRPGPFAGGPRPRGPGAAAGPGNRLPGGRTGPGGRGGPTGPGAPAAPGGPGGVDLIHQDGAREFFDAVTRLVAPGEVIFLQDPPVASLVTGVTGRWTSGGILRDVRSAEGRARPEECEFLAMIGRGPMAGGPGLGRSGGPGGFGGPGGIGGPGGPRGLRGPGGFEPPPGFERVFENSFGSLWKNDGPGLKREPSKPAVSLPALAVFAALSILLLVLDYVLGAGRTRARLVVAAAAFIGASVCLAPLAWTAGGELLNPPEAPPAGADMPFGGPPPGIGGPGGPGLDGPPPDVPEAMRERYVRIQRALFERLGAGEDPRWLWAPEDEMSFRDLLETGKPAEAEALLDGAIERLEKAETRDAKGPAGERR